MTHLSHRILQALDGDPPSVQALAGAIAARDVDGVRGVLSGRGVELSAEEAASVVSFASGGGNGATIATIATIFTIFT